MASRVTAIGYYPFGAVLRGDLLEVGMIIYTVHGLGSASFLEALHINEFIESGRIAVNDIKTGFQDTMSFRDFNVDMINGYNSHYIFHDREDAEAYHAWALENTQNRRNDYKDEPWNW